MLEFSLILIKANSEGNLASKSRSGCETNGLLWDMKIVIHTFLTAQESVWPRPSCYPRQDLLFRHVVLPRLAPVSNEVKQQELTVSFHLCSLPIPSSCSLPHNSCVHHQPCRAAQNKGGTFLTSTSGLHCSTVKINHSIWQEEVMTILQENNSQHKKINSKGIF